MKFLCPSCKAKYQIADEKVAGRTLRMSCRQCKEDIVIRGDSVSQASSAGTLAAPPAAGAPNRLGADFQRQVAAGGPGHQTPPAGHDEWHVAINDIPVGPMRREEVARKIAMGAVGPDSLAWREGLDDWLPVRHIAELAVLCPPASVAPGGPSGTGLPPPPPASQVSAPPAPPPPTQRAPEAPVGGRQGAGVQDTAPSLPAPTPPAAPAEPPPARSYGADLDTIPRTGSNISWAQMFLLVCGGAFILAMGTLLGKMLFNQDQPQVATPQATTEPPSSEAPQEPSEQEVQEEVAAADIELDLQEIDGETPEPEPTPRRTGGSTRKKPANTGASASGASSNKSGKTLTQAEKDMLARMGGGINAPVNNLNTGSRRGSSGSSNRSALTAAQLSRVVSKGKRSLQRCYETALRGAGTDEAVRMDVSLTISASGNVKSARTSGRGLPGMSTCIARTVKTWRFPKSSGETSTKFPIVFQPGG